MIVLNTASLVVCLTAAIIDGIAAYFLQRTNFRECSYTSTALVSPCDNSDCSGIEFPVNTCYCCHILETLQDQCEVPLLMGQKYYFSSVKSCMSVGGELRIMLSILTVLHIVNSIICVVGIFKTSSIEHVRTKYTQLMSSEVKPKVNEKSSLDKKDVTNNTHDSPTVEDKDVVIDEEFAQTIKEEDTSNINDIPIEDGEDTNVVTQSYDINMM